MGLALQSTEFKRLRLEILQRDQYTCYMCGGEANEVDHIYPRSKDLHDMLHLGAEVYAAASKTCSTFEKCRHGAHI